MDESVEARRRETLKSDDNSHGCSLSDRSFDRGFMSLCRENVQEAEFRVMGA